MLRTFLTLCAHFRTGETGVLGAVLTSPKVSAELIADGVHVDQAAMRMLVELKTPESRDPGKRWHVRHWNA